MNERCGKLNNCISEKNDIEKAYQEEDIQISRELHDNKVIEDYHKISGSEWVKSIIYGGLDGIITTFAIVSSAYAGGLSKTNILMLGLANILADAISMGHGDYFSEKVEQDYVMDQYKREKWEMKNYPEGEKKEMIELYTKKHNIGQEDAETIINTMAKYEDFFIDHMMVIELELMPPDTQSNPIKNGLITFFSFIFFGSVPLLSFLISDLFYVSCIFSLMTLGLLGLIRARFTKSNAIYSCISTIFNGSLSAGLAYLVGWGISQ